MLSKETHTPHIQEKPDCDENYLRL
jgi:hypothetical protein